MKKFSTIKEIRNEIDKLDIRIIDLISQRKDLVFEVVKLKRKARTSLSVHFHDPNNVFLISSCSSFPNTTNHQTPCTVVLFFKV